MDVEDAKKRLSIISEEFERGFNFLTNYPRSVTIFGSTRARPGDADYDKAANIASRVVKELHYSIITGGGPGIMEAANKGAYEAGGNSLGLTIELPHPQVTNKYLTDTVDFSHFFTRKVCMAFSAEAYLFFPGGFGTLDEFTEILTLVQTNKIDRIPIILVGADYWSGLIKFFRENILAEGKIDEEDFSLFKIIDNDDEIIEEIKKAPVFIGALGVKPLA